MGFSQYIRINLTSSVSLSRCKYGLIRQNRKQKSIAFPTTRRRRFSSSTVKSVFNDTRRNINDNEAAEPARVLLERLFAQTQKLEKQTDQSSVYSDGNLPFLNLEMLESGLQAALMALIRREEDLEGAERKVISEQNQLNRAKEELEQREREIAEASLKHESLQEDLKQANAGLASRAREIEELKRELEERDRETAAMQASLTLKDQELDKLRNEVSDKSKEISVAMSEIQTKSRLLSQANEVVRRQEVEIRALQKGIEEKEEELEDLKATRKLDREKLGETEANLEKQTKEWLLVREEVKKLEEEAAKRVGEANEAADDFRRVRKLLTDVRSELVSSQKSLAFSREQMEEKEMLLEKQITELEEHRNSVVSYMTSLRDARAEMESERAKLKITEARNKALERDLSIQKQLVRGLGDDLKKERSLLERAVREISVLRNDLSEKTNAFRVAQDLLQEKETSLVEAKLEIQHLKSEQASLQILLEEKDLELADARNGLEEANKEVAELKERDDRLHKVEHELSSMKLKATDAETMVERIAELASKLVIPTKDRDYDSAMVDDQIEFEMIPGKTRDSYRLEMEVVAAQRALTIKDEEIKAVTERLEAKEREFERLKEETINDSEDLRQLYVLTQERIGETTIGELAIEKLQIKAAQLEVEAATSALQKLAEMSRELLSNADMSIEAEATYTVIPIPGNGFNPDMNSDNGFNPGMDSDNGFNPDMDSDTSNECIAEVKAEVARLTALTEKLLKEAGICAGGG